MTGWADHVIWWHVYPLGFVDAEKSALPPGAPPMHRLDRFDAWLDYLLALGCNGLALGPVFRSATHGYDTVDHLTVDPRLGTEEDLRRLIDVCAARGVRVLLDGVFNHVGRDHPFVQDVLAHGRASQYASWFRIDWDAPDFRYDTFEGHQHLVALNHDEPAVADYVTSVLRYWLTAGADGWRLDAAYAVAPEFWRKTVGRVRAEFPDAWFVGEMIHGDYAGYVATSGLDSVTQYELWKATWSALADRNLFELAWALERHAAFAAAFVPQTFLGNHDVTRLADQIGDDRHLGHAIAVLATLPGVPSVYAGDEQAFRGRKENRAGGDDAVRPPFPSSPADLAPYGQGVYRLHQELFGLRRRHSWLVRGLPVAENIANASLIYRVNGPDGQHVRVALNLADEPLTVAGTGYRVGAGAAARTGAGVSVPGHEFAVLLPE
ncbi:alpha-amylase family protein [Cryptosporangium aurantiacum]|uniref:Glycosidase n=1 Tax=Cryptosporangium aurantiacum TaxID=134849 RepID=A0A1M7RP37_9ACTN|nr:alpha-amylase family protein [Cryptosporangium aurantiacum]SHN48024.1 Glycosidase [Cryptosporangium aurantiacum]